MFSIFCHVIASHVYAQQLLSTTTSLCSRFHREILFKTYQIFSKSLGDARNTIPSQSDQVIMIEKVSLDISEKSEDETNKSHQKCLETHGEPDIEPTLPMELQDNSGDRTDEGKNLVIVSACDIHDHLPYFELFPIRAEVFLLTSPTHTSV